MGARIDGATVDWPQGEELALGFSEQPVRIYRGRLDLALADPGDSVTMHLQTCSDSLCLEPESATFRLR